MKNILQPMLILAAVALVCAVALSQVQKLTAPYLEAQKKRKEAESLALVLPGYEVGPQVRADVDGKPFEFWEGVKKQGDGIESKAFAFKTSFPGYAGPVESMVGVDEKGIVIAITVLQQNETPGLGSVCAEAESGQTLWGALTGSSRKEGADTVPWFQKQFSGVDAGREIRLVKKGPWRPELRDELLQENAVSALTGATITSTAVVRSVREGFSRLAKAREQAAAAKGGGR